MSSLQWSDALSMDLPQMDDTHREFVDLLAAVESADDDALLPAWRALVAHTDDHFGREDRWMQDTRFASSNCHSVQHKVVLEVMREGERQPSPHRNPIIRQLARELAVWFPQHAQAMDASLALHLRRVGYDPVSGLVHMPDALPAGEIHGCGSSTCAPDASETHDATATAGA